MATYTYDYGDYRYTLDDSNYTASIKVIDRTKSSYAAITSPINYNGDEYVVTKMSDTFDGCSSLTSAPEIPASVVNMRDTFNSCISLTSAPEIPSSVTNMSYTFGGCSSLTSAPEIPASVVNMEATFSGCTSLTSVPEIPSSVMDMTFTFIDCSALKGDLIVNNEPLSYSHMFTGAIPSGETLNIYYIGTDSSAQSTWQSIVNSYDRVTMPTISGGEEFNHGDYKYTLESSSPYNASVKVIDSTKSSYGIIESPITVNGTNSNVTSLKLTFYNCQLLTTAPEVPTSVTNMQDTFNGCTSLVTAPIIPNNVTNLAFTFCNCTSLVTAPIIPSSVTDMYYTFSNCPALTGNIIVNNKPITFNVIFSNIIKNIYIINNSTIQGADTIWKSIANTYSNVYYGANSPILRISQNLPEDVEYISASLYKNNILLDTPIQYDSNTHSVIGQIGKYDLDYAGEQITLNIKAQASDSIDLLQETKKTKIRVKDNMIYSKPIKKDPYAEAYAVFDSSDNSLIFFRDEANKYTNNQTSGTKTYYTGIETTNYSSYSDIPWYSKRASVTNVTFEDEIAPISTACWFYAMDNDSFTNITGLNKLNTSNVTNMYSMFYSCSSLTSLDVSNFDTSNVTDMGWMFYNCRALTSLNVNNFDTSNVTKMSYTFYQCVALTSLDLTSFDMNRVTNTTRMFQGNILLAIIYVSDKWDASNISISENMFFNCKAIIGGQGTTYDSSIIDKTRAKIDGGVSDPGYLTYKAVSNNS